MAKRFRSKRRAYRRKGVKKSRRVGRRMAKTIKKVVRSMETMKTEIELLTPVPDGTAIGGIIAQEDRFYRCIPKIFIGVTAQERPYFEVHPLSCVLDVFVWFDESDSHARDLSVYFYLLKSKIVKEYDDDQFNNTGFPSYQTWLRADGETPTNFVGDWRSSIYPVNDTEVVLVKKKAFRMMKPSGTSDRAGAPLQQGVVMPLGMIPTYTDFQLASVAIAGVQTPYKASHRFSVSIPMPKVLKYQIGTATTSAQQCLPTNYAPIWCMGIVNNQAGRPLDPSFFPLRFHAQVRMKYKDR